MLNRVALAGLLLAGVLANGVRAEGPPSPPQVQRTYPVADLIAPQDNYLVEPGSLSLGSPKRCPSAPEAKQDELMKLIVHIIAPTTWSVRGGPGTIDYFPLGKAFVVQQTPEIHERIAELLGGLLRMKDLEVTVEVRLLSLSGTAFERTCAELGIQPEETDLDDTPPDAAAVTSTRTLLNDLQIFQLMEMIQGDRRSQVMQAPKVTMFDGQTSSIQVVDHQFFVTGVQIVQQGGSVVFVPRQESVAVGVQMQVKLVVSADRRSVRLDLKMHCTDVAATVPLWPLELFITPVFEGGAQGTGQRVTFPKIVQQPKIRRLNLDETIQVPDNSTVLLTGWKRTHQVPSELGGLLADLLGPNFAGLRQREETEHLLLLVTPRIIVSEEEATLGTGVGCLPPPPVDVPDLFADPRGDERRIMLRSADDERRPPSEPSANPVRKAVELPQLRPDNSHGRFPDLFGEACVDELAGTRLPRYCEMFKLADNYQRACEKGQCLTAYQLFYEALLLDPNFGFDLCTSYPQTP